jgi:pimeloyl-ACP methyl ester carboxylesterase
MSSTLLQRPETPPVAPEGPQRIDPLFRTSETRAMLRAMYDRQLAKWPVPFEELDVATSYGNTRVVVAGKAEAEPVMLFHMTGCPAFIWTPIIASLSARYRTFAVDIIGDFGRSELADPARYPKSGAQLAAWAYEVADALRLESSHVLGASFGGWLAMHYASHAPRRVRRLALVVPMGLPPWPQTLRVIARLTALLIGRSEQKTERTLTWMMGDHPRTRALAGDWMRTIIDRHLRVRVANPFPLSSRQLQRIEAPTLVVLGGRDQLLGDPCRAAARAWNSIAKLEIEIFPHGTHAVHTEEPDAVAGRILEFLGR